MSWKWIGAVLVITGCGGFGFSMAVSCKREEAALRQLINALNFMECELQYRLTPLPELCRQAGRSVSGQIGQIFLLLSKELEQQTAPDAASCMNTVLSSVSELPKSLRLLLRSLGQSMGKFDMAGQLQGLESVRKDCRRALDHLSKDRDVRLRSYQTLGVCAGAALVILFI